MNRRCEVRQGPSWLVWGVHLVDGGEKRATGQAFVHRIVVKTRCLRHKPRWMLVQSGC